MKAKIHRFWAMGKDNKGLNPVTLLPGEPLRLTKNGVV